MEKIKRKKNKGEDRTWNGFIHAISRDENEAAESDLKKRMALSLVLLAAQLAIHFSVAGRYAIIAEGSILALLIIVNIRCFSDGFMSVKRRQPEKNLLAAIGTILTICILHFVTAGTIMTAMAICRYLEAYISLKLNTHLTDLIELEPSDSGIHEGDIIQILEGEVIPVDGIIMSGGTTIDEEMITGERIPAMKRDGDLVFAGTRNLSSEITIKVTHVGGRRVISRIILHIGRSITTKPPKSKRYEKVARRFVIAVIAIAVVAAALWAVATGDIVKAVITGTTVLIIANPYAFSVSIPMTVLAAVIRGAEHGILIRSANILEDTRDINTIIINKRGTVTAGDPEISDVIPIEDEFDLKLAGILESGAKHPFGQMIYRKAVAEFGDLPDVEQVESIEGRGISCWYKGNIYAVGNAAYMVDKGVYSSTSETDALFRQGKSLVFFADEKKILGVIALRDAPKPQSLKAITQMENMGLDVVMVTGDSRQTADAIRSEIGLDQVYADILPSEKAGVVDKIRHGNDKIVAMVGDGRKDGPAIRAADLGIAIGSGRQISISDADIILVTDDLLDVVRAMRLSKLSVRNLRQSVAFAYAYNTLAILCAAGIFSLFTGMTLIPVAAAVCMCASQILVTLNSFRIRRARL